MKQFLNMIFHKNTTFIDNFNEFEKIQEKNNKGAIGTEQKKLLKYGKESKKLSKRYILLPQDLNREKD